jgi:hypothetical protein
MTSSIISSLPSDVPLLSGVAVLLALLLSTIVPGWWSERSLSKIPLWGDELPAKTRRDALLKDSKSIYFKTYLEVGYKNQPFPFCSALHLLIRAY